MNHQYTNFDCTRCIELVSTYSLAHGPGFPDTVVEYLSTEPTIETPLCPLCDNRAGDLVLEIGTEGYLHRLLASIESGEPMLCELCTHRAAHYAQEFGVYGFLAILEQYLSGTLLLLEPFLERAILSES